MRKTATFDIRQAVADQVEGAIRQTALQTLGQQDGCGKAAVSWFAYYARQVRPASYSQVVHTQPKDARIYDCRFGEQRQKSSIGGTAAARTFALRGPDLNSRPSGRSLAPASPPPDLLGFRAQGRREIWQKFGSFAELVRAFQSFARSEVACQLFAKAAKRKGLTFP